MTRFLLALLLLPLALAAPATVSAADGKTVYSTTCIACHGVDGKGAIPGVPDLGMHMEKSDAELIQNALNGVQSKGSTLAMPPKGGNPNLTEADVAAVIGYIRTLFAQTGAARVPAAVDPADNAVPPPELATAEAAPVADSTSQPSSPPTAEIAVFARGAKAWGENCARCHAMHNPDAFTDDQWKVITTHMRLRAGLDGADVRDITVFLTGSN